MPDLVHLDIDTGKVLSDALLEGKMILLDDDVVDAIGELFWATFHEPTRSVVRSIAEKDNRHVGRQMRFVIEHWTQTIPWEATL